MQEKTRKPEIRFTGFSDEWQPYKFGELGTVEMNRRIYKHQTYEKGDIPFYKIGTFGSEPDAYISRELFEEYKNKYPYPNVGDILISASGSIGRTVEYKGKDEYFQDSNIIWFRHDNRISNVFLKYLYSVVKWAGIEGSTIKRLYNDNILNTEFLLPSMDEQICIGDIFKCMDNFISLYQRKYTQLVNIKKTMLKRMFPQNESTVPEVRFAGFKDDWKLCKLTEFVEFYNGLTYKPSDIRETGTLVLRSSNVCDGKIVNADNVYVTEEAVDCSNVSEGDIIMVVRNGSRSLIGKHAQIKQSMPNTVIGAFMTGIKADVPSFINALLSTNKFDSEVAMNMGATINQITGYMFSKMEFLIPRKDEQEIIGAFFNNLDDLIIFNQCKLEKLQNIKKSCLEKMFVS